MTWLLGYAIGGLLFLVVMLAVASRPHMEEGARRKFVFAVLRDAIIWPIGTSRFALFMLEAWVEQELKK